MQMVLVIDDDKISHSFAKRALKDSYALIHAFSGEEGFALAIKEQPDLILLDVEMPGLNGYAVCEQLKAHPQTVDIPVIFLSAHDELCDRMQGFEAGADDYIVKPFQAEALLAKLKVITHYQQKQNELVEQVDEAVKTARIAISGSGDLGLAIQFIENSHTVKTHEQLVQAFFRVTNSMDLNCSLIVTTDAGESCFATNGNNVSPLEVGLMTTLRQSERFFDFGCRTQINYPRISVLIKNMPLNDMERYGRIKDVLPAMLSSADIKVIQINTLLVMTEQIKATERFFQEITQALDSLNLNSQQQQREGIAIMRRMMMELDARLPTMGLENDQEEYILNRIDSAIDEAHNTISKVTKTGTALTQVIGNLRELIARQQILHEQIQGDESAYASSEQVGYEMDVELF